MAIELTWGDKTIWKSGGKEIATKSSSIPSATEIDGALFNVIGSGPSYALGDIGNIFRIRAFVSVPEVNAIFNLRARAAGNMRIIAVDSVTGLEIPTPNDRIIQLINEPNYFQSREELFGQTTLFRDIFGNEVIYAMTPRTIKNPTGLFTLPYQNITIENNNGSLSGTGPFYLNKQLPKSIVYFYKDSDGRKYPLNSDNLLHLNDNNIKTNNSVDYLKGMSKLDALQAPIENLIAAYEARNVLIVNRGAIGILSNASKDGIGGAGPMDKKETKRLQQEFKRYGLTKGQWQVIITNLSLSWQQMAIDVDKLKLFEETREDTLKICDAYGTPYEMLSSIRNTTFDNKKEAQRQWYRDTIIPEANTRIAGINRKFKLAERGYRLVPKFDHLPIFETERKERAQSLLLTVNALTKALEDEAISIEQYQLELKKFGI